MTFSNKGISIRNIKVKLDNHESNLEEIYVKNNIKKLNDIIFNINDTRSSKPKSFKVLKYPCGY